MDTLQFPLPDWLHEQEARWAAGTGVDDPMAQVIRLSRLNAGEGGGPFAAAIVDEHGTLIALGTNRVIPSRCSHWHAEMLAIARAQQHFQTHDLAAHRTVLYSSCEPCAMCIGAILWSGVHALVYAARDEDARAIGFDEGPKMDGWQAYLQSRGIQVGTADAHRAAAQQVLVDYQEQGNIIY